MTEKRLISLEENDAAARGRLASRPAPRPNGIECPECGAEMVDHLGEMLMSMPPQLRVSCPDCGRKDTRCV